jgi:hypothetical protein
VNVAAGSLETVKTVSDVVSNVVTIGAVLVGAVWAYWAFLRERTRWPKATLELVLYHRELSAEQTLLHAKVKIHNAGRGLMELTRVRAVVDQVLPLASEVGELEDGYLDPTEKEGETNWKPFAEGERVLQAEEAETEPGENDEFGFDFAVPSSFETVHVYVYVENFMKRGKKLGWCVTNYYDLSGKAGGESAVNVVTEPTSSSSVQEAV